VQIVMVMEMAGHGDLLEYTKRVCGCAGVRVSWPWPVSADRDGDGDGWARRSAGVRQAGVRVCG